MYAPAHFREERLAVLHEAIGQARLATLVTLGGGGLEASHIPVLLEADEGENGTLYGHLARGNPQWKTASTSVPALMIFMGPDAYISPSWYAEKAKNGKVVPTWNYVTVHATGDLEFFEEKDRLLSLVTSLTEKHESQRAQPWAVSDAPADYIDAHLKGIVGFRLPIARLEGKWKMSQNRNREDRQGVVTGLGEASGPLEEAVAEIMAREIMARGL
jgi:transcriptional regulator